MDGLADDVTRTIIDLLPVFDQMRVSSTSRSMHRLVCDVQDPFLEGVDMEACLDYSRQGDLRRLKWVVEHGMPFDKHDCEEAAARNGHWEVLEWLHTRFSAGEPWNKRVVYAAAKTGRLQVLQAMARAAPGVDASAVLLLGVASGSGNLELMQWLLDIGCTWSMFMYSDAASSNQVAVLEWLRQQGCPMDFTSIGLEIDAAARVGNLPMIAWLRNYSCPWGQDACYYAVIHEDLELLQWLRAQTPPCPWGPHDLLEVANPEVTQWLLEQSYEQP